MGCCRRNVLPQPVKSHNPQKLSVIILPPVRMGRVRTNLLFNSIDNTLASARTRTTGQCSLPLFLNTVQCLWQSVIAAGTTVNRDYVDIIAASAWSQRSSIGSWQWRVQALSRKLFKWFKNSWTTMSSGRRSQRLTSWITKAVHSWEQWKLSSSCFGLRYVKCIVGDLKKNSLPNFILRTLA